MDSDFFTTDVSNFPKLVSKVLIADVKRGGNWFVDFKCGNLKYIVFRDKILKYEIGNIEEKIWFAENAENWLYRIGK